jgi:hypothetical protein
MRTEFAALLFALLLLVLASEKLAAARAAIAPLAG